MIKQKTCRGKCKHPDTLRPRRGDSSVLLPGIDNELMIGSKSLRERLGVAFATSLKENIVRSPDEMGDVAVATKEAQFTKDRVSQVMVASEAIGTAGDRRALPEDRDEIKETLVAVYPDVFGAGRRARS